MVGLPRANSNILVKFCIKLGNTASFFLGGGGGVLNACALFITNKWLKSSVRKESNRKKLT